jgi:hypothetical protein
MDDKELRKMVEETMELSKDNNRMLHAIQRRAKTALVFRVVYWVFIIGAAAGAFYFIQPYVDGIMNAYTGFVDTQHKVAEFGDKFSFDKLKEYFK